MVKYFFKVVVKKVVVMSSGSTFWSTFLNVSGHGLPVNVSLHLFSLSTRDLDDDGI